MSETSIGPKKLLLVLSAVITVTTAILLVLAAIPKSTLIELAVLARRVSFTTLPTLAGGSFEPLHNQLKIHGMEIQNPDFFTAQLKVTPGRQFQTEPDTTVYLKCTRPSKPVIKLFGGAMIDLRAYKREHVVATVNFSADEPNAMWQSWIREPCELKINQPVATADTGQSDLPVGDWMPLSNFSKLRLRGGTNESRFGLQLAGISSRSASLLRVIDLQTGQTTLKQGVEFRLPESPTVIPHQDRLIVIEKNTAADHGIHLFKPNFEIRDPQFFKLTGQQGQSFVIGGTIRFPAKERPTVPIESDAFIRIDDDSPLMLKSMQLLDGHLKLVLWGRPESLKVGPAAGLLTEHLPSLLLWSYTHKTGTLMFSILGWIVGSSLAALKLFGLITK